jgi:octanoyl-[GcvH]:protein N-octanoyltransferase
MKTEFELLREAFPDRPETGPALSRILLDQVAAGERPATVRLSRPGRVVAFGRRDIRADGYGDAVSSARASGFGAMERITGGRVAAYSEGTLSLTLTIPDEEPAMRTNRRFEDAATIARDAFGDLGIDARIGEVPGEYCTGDFSVNARGQAKLAGIGQRMIKGAAHVGFVIVVSGSELLREVLDPVHDALGLEWNPETVGAAEDEVQGLGLGAVEAALLGRLEATYDLRPTILDPDTLRRAGERAVGFRSPG